MLLHLERDLFLIGRADVKGLEQFGESVVKAHVHHGAAHRGHHALVGCCAGVVGFGGFLLQGHDPLFTMPLLGVSFETRAGDSGTGRTYY